ncbi:24545_t:CDS:1, partial [Racocetra persica]
MTVVVVDMIDENALPAVKEVAVVEISGVLETPEAPEDEVVV